MAYEVFDDAAFGFFAQSMLCVLLLPFTYYRWIKPAVRKHLCGKQQQGLCDCEHCTARNQAHQAREVGFARHLTLGNIILAIGWTCFLVLTVYLALSGTDRLVSFDPFEVLGLDQDATDKDIKKAFRSKSKLYHPDRNPSEEAREMFAAITKAHDALMDPATRENFEMFGSIDGGKRVTSYTIGLPSFLTDEQNQGGILVGYMLLVLVIPAVGMFLWWRSASERTSSGLYTRSLMWFQEFMMFNSSPPSLTWCMAISQEYNDIIDAQDFTPELAKALTTLNANVTQSVSALPPAPPKLKAASKGKNVSRVQQLSQYFHRAHLYLYAHMSRTPVPDVLEPAYTECVLKSADLIRGMLYICQAKQWWFTSVSVLHLSQRLAQGITPDAHDLMQLPYFSHQTIRQCRKMKITSLRDLIFAPLARQMQALQTLETAQRDTVLRVLKRYPRVEVACGAGVAGDQDESKFSNMTVEEGCQVTFSIQVRKVITGGAEVRVKTEEGVSEPVLVKSEPVAEQSETTQGEGAGEEDGDASSSDEYSDDEDFPNYDVDKIRRQKRMALAYTDDTEKERALTHTFPDAERKERWFAIVYRPKVVDQGLIFMTQIPALCSVQRPIPEAAEGKKKPSAQQDGDPRSDPEGWETVEFSMNSGKPGKYPFNVRIMSDSYVGLDYDRKFCLNVVKRKDADKKEEEEEKEPKEPVKSWWERLDSDEEAEWWEYVLTFVLLVLIGVCLFNMSNTTWWHNYITPVVKVVRETVGPYTEWMDPYVRPIYEWVVRWLTAVGDYLSVEEEASAASGGDSYHDIEVDDW